MFSEIQQPTPIRRPRMQLEHDLIKKKCVGQLVADIGLTEEGCVSGCASACQRNWLPVSAVIDRKQLSYENVDPICPWKMIL